MPGLCDFWGSDVLLTNLQLDYLLSVIWKVVFIAISHYNTIVP